MKITLYYFSATGNCLTTARMLAEELGDCRLVPVASVRRQSKVKEETRAVGFVCPVYYGDVPFPVRELVSKMVFVPDSYIVLVTTRRGHDGDVAKRFDQLLKTRGQRLSLAQGIPMPGNSFINLPQVDADCLKNQRENVHRIIAPIQNRETCDYTESAVLPLSPVAYPNNFRGIVADDTCIGCGICKQVCPMDNIDLRNEKAVIGDDCATCLSCFHWCPVEAIYMSRQEEIARRRKYHHPDITLADITAQKTIKH